MKISVKKGLSRAIIVVSTLLALPSISYASYLWAYASQSTSEANSQNLQLLQPANLIDDIPSTSSGVAFYAETGPSGTLADISESHSTQISTYAIRSGDTLSDIAQMFGVSVNTIIAANEGLTAKNLKVGQNIIILPVTGIRHTVAKGETVSSIVAKYKSRTEDILAYNDITIESIKVGDTLIIPDVEPVIQSPTQPKLTAALHGASGPSYPGYYKIPLNNYVRTQGLHGYNGVDLAAPIGTPIHAAAAGTVIISRTGLWNQGYGNYVVISHPNGTQTLYAHASQLLVSVGQKVTKGEKIALVGNTGKSTGPHLHFEIRGAKNPF